MPKKKKTKKTKKSKKVKLTNKIKQPLKQTERKKRNFICSYGNIY